jgi:hypothetical protein
MLDMLCQYLLWTIEVQVVVCHESVAGPCHLLLSFILLEQLLHLVQQAQVSGVVLINLCKAHSAICIRISWCRYLREPR